jgi:hypothetical protein
MADKSFKRANDTYESWLRAELKGDIIEDDLRKKWDKMARGPFPFLRATYWRWAETILDVCPDLATSPSVLAVGDIHLENFGTWRDDDGRLVWGVNDFDEAAETPYVLDLVRLATSALLARASQDIDGNGICTAILQGYAKGVDVPRPLVLDEEYAWLRKLTVVTEEERGHFWKKIDEMPSSTEGPADRYRQAIADAMPEPSVEIAKFFQRTAGTGSLGRPRWVGVADWRGGRVVREAKALVMSGWTRITGRGSPSLRCKEIAFGRYRAPDRWYQVVNDTAVRRLSPNNRKIEIKRQSDELLSMQMLQAMGLELANIHLGTGEGRAAVHSDLSKRRSGWLNEAAGVAAKFVISEHGEWRGGIFQ